MLAAPLKSMPNQKHGNKDTRHTGRNVLGKVLGQEDRRTDSAGLAGALLSLVATRLAPRVTE